MTEETAAGAVPSLTQMTQTTFRFDALQVVKGATWCGAAIAAGMGLEYATQVLLASRLGPADFGLLRIGLQIFNVAVILSLLGLPDAMAYFIPRRQLARRGGGVDVVSSAGFWSSLITSLVVSSALLLLAEPIALGLFNQPGLLLVIRLLALAIPGTALSQLLGGVLRGLRASQQGSLLASSVYDRSARLGFVILALCLGLGLGGAATAYPAASMVVLVLALHFARGGRERVRLAVLKRTAVQELFVYSWPLLLSQLLAAASAAVQPAMLLYFLDAASAGIYSVAALVLQGPAMVLQAFSFIYLPVATAALGRGDSSEVRRMYHLTTGWSLMAIWPISLLILLMPEVVLSFFGVEYQEGASTLRLLAVAGLVNVASGYVMVASTLLAAAKTRSYLLFDSVGISISTGLGLLLIPGFGLVGAALGRLISTVVWNGLALIAVYRLCHIQPIDRQCGRILLVGLVCLVPVYPLTNLAVGLTPWAIFVAMVAHTALTVFVLMRFHLLSRDSQEILGEVFQAGTGLLRSVRQRP